jgi:phosphonatase-like hydrolase
MIKLIVFDMAGTTVNEENVVYKTVHNAIERSGFHTDLDTVLLYAAGKEKYQAIFDVLTHLQGIAPNKDLAQNIFEDFEALLDGAYAHLQPLPMPGLPELFKTLREKGIKTAINTGYQRPVAELLLDKLDWAEGREFDLLVTASDVSRSRPHPDMIELAMGQLGVNDPWVVAKVGDSMIDIEEGKQAGCGLTVGITTGAHTHEQLMQANPTHVIDHLDELLDLW